jgi:hypothetical protein
MTRIVFPGNHTRLLDTFDCPDIFYRDKTKDLNRAFPHYKGAEASRLPSALPA